MCGNIVCVSVEERKYTAPLVLGQRLDIEYAASGGSGSPRGEARHGSQNMRDGAHYAKAPAPKGCRGRFTATEGGQYRTHGG